MHLLIQKKLPNWTVTNTGIVKWGCTGYKPKSKWRRQHNSNYHIWFPSSWLGHPTVVLHEPLKTLSSHGSPLVEHAACKASYCCTQQTHTRIWSSAWITGGTSSNISHAALQKSSAAKFIQFGRNVYRARQAQGWWGCLGAETVQIR